MPKIDSLTMFEGISSGRISSDLHENLADEEGSREENKKRAAFHTRNRFRPFEGFCFYETIPMVR
jgi:hypothetical protein